MFMWTVGYTVGDIMYVAQTTADQGSASWFSKLPDLLSYLSYTNPDWAAGVLFERELDFPAALPQTGRFKDHKCALFNGNTSEIITAVLEDHTFMEIRVTAAQHFGRPFAVILYSPTAHIESEVSRWRSTSFVPTAL
ncbi:uncharacterized protein ACA1_353200 [Acanthamoeba castellanii str. Neff]|uniref:Uncharacterized protein n=1 Tax=Acanthamoeba castellanii (strain ATCC 30010 / Neff) TaxID=1257118 RepID=L8GH07_ACACF|nr:uncharacterized protein ACA1_353200 [Acanthamoeba castellanii str. Neff]ELR12028.1 hypothetical protein ACA1_353200 [Acanthamoeba castellanii str. Neff]